MFTVNKPPSLVKTVLGAVVTNAIALGAAFGIHLTDVQRGAILGTVAPLSAVIVGAVAYVHAHHVKAAATVEALSTKVSAPASASAQPGPVSGTTPTPAPTP